MVLKGRAALLSGTAIAWTLACLLCATVAVTAEAQVVSYKKISHNPGGIPELPNDAFFGTSAHLLGDLDGDGKPEVAIGALNDDSPGVSGTGSVRILTLSSAGLPLAQRVINGGDIGNQLLHTDRFGSSVAYLGDLDGPGPATHAIAVGADAGTVPNRTGAVWILFLNNSGAVLSYNRIDAADGLALLPGDAFGTSLAWLGDLDGPGPSVATLAVGAAGDDDGGCSERGAVWILSLDAAGNVIAHTKISATHGGFGGALGCQDYFGESIASLGDLDGPGGSAHAIAVGALFDDDGGLDAGALWILFLNQDGSVASYSKLGGLNPSLAGVLDSGDRFGASVDVIGDRDGDGVPDLIVGADSDDDGDTPAPGTPGAVYLVLLTPQGMVKGYQKISKTQGGFGGDIGDNEAFGCSAACVGDLDGDGNNDVCVGEAQDNDGGQFRGAVWTIFLDHLLVGVGDPPAASLRLLTAIQSAGRDLTVSFVLPGEGPAWLDLFDAGGRRITKREVGSLGGGRHDMQLAIGNQIAKGVYWVALSRSGERVSRKVALIR